MSPITDPVAVTFRALPASVEAEHELKLFLDTLMYIGEQAAGFVPPLEGPQDLTITSDQVAEAIKCQPDDPGLPLVQELITNSVWEIWSGSGTTPDGHWQITVIPEKARVYRDFTSVSALLQAREQREQQRQRWGAIKSVQLLTPDDVPDPTSPAEHADTKTKNTVFVVYGRNDLARAAMFEFLRRSGSSHSTGISCGVRPGNIEVPRRALEVLGSAGGFRRRRSLSWSTVPDAGLLSRTHGGPSSRDTDGAKDHHQAPAGPAGPLGREGTGQADFEN
jgi:hypothetical protein